MGSFYNKPVKFGVAIMLAMAATLLALAPRVQAASIDLNSQNGATTILRTDLVIGKQFPIAITRSYNSKSVYTSPLGSGWTLGYDKQLFTYPDNSVIIRSGPGAKMKFTLSGSAYTSPAGDTGILTKNSNTDGTYTFTYTFLNGTTELFDVYGRLAKITDPKGNTLVLTYASTTKSALKGLLPTSSNQSAVSDVAYVYQLTKIEEKNNSGTVTGKSVTFAYDPATGLLSSCTDSLGRVITYAHGDSYGNLTSVSGSGVSSTYGYTNPNFKHHLTSADEGHGVYTTVYDSQGRVDTQTHGNTTISVVYTTPGLITTITTTVKDSGGAIVSTESRTVEFDVNKQLVKHTDTLGNQIIYTRNSQSWITRKTWKKKNDAGLLVLDHAIDFKDYDAQGNFWTKIETDGDANSIPPVTATFSYTTSYTYDSRGNMLTVTTPQTAAGQPNQTVYTYNSANQLLTISSPQGEIHATYYPDGNLHTVANTLIEPVTAPFGVTTYDYTNGNLTSITDANGKVTTIHYDANDQIDWIKDATLRQTDYHFDTSGNLRTITETGNKITTLDYDALYRLTTVTDPLSHVTTNHYLNGNRDSVKDANDHFTTYGYNDEGQVTTITTPLITNLTPQQQYVTRLIYGGNSCPSCGGSGGGNLVALEDARHQTTNFEYDFLNRLKSESDPLNKTTSYFYNTKWNLDHKTDAKDRTATYSYDVLKRLTGISYQDNSTTSNVTYSYDDLLRTRTVTNGDISYVYSYDAAWRLASVTDSRSNTIDYEYYPTGKRSKMTLQKGSTADKRVFDYTYDDAGRPQTISSAAGLFTYNYDLRGRRTTLAYPNQITATYDYDDASRLTGISNATVSATIAATTYPVIDNVGNRKTKTSNGSQTEQYVYDEIDRLTTVSGNNPESFAYDAVGNRTSGPGAKDSAYSHDASNRMTHGRKLGYAYDDNGNQISRTDAEAMDKTWTQSWDDENRLIKAEIVKGTEHKTVTFKYDPMGRRISKQLVTVVNGVTQPSITWSYVYDGSDIVLEIYTVQNTPVVKTVYTHGAGVDEHLAMEQGSSYYYYHADGLGSVTTITNASRAIVQSYSYDSFGMPKPANTILRNSYTYTGREWDKETGLYYYRARYYDSMEGRFISKDPIGFAGGDVNVYGYVQNNPINFIDPTGLATYQINRELGGNEPRSTWNPVSHTLIAITDANGTIVNTYSWGNIYKKDGFLQTKWAPPDMQDDLIAADRAIKSGKAFMISEGFLDPYVRKAYQELSKSGYETWSVFDSCKHKAKSLLDRAFKLAK